MQSQDLVNTGWQLARPCINLHDALPSEPVIAVWGGDGIVPGPFGSYAHWISLDCRALPHASQLQIGWLSVYVTTDDFESGVVVVDPATVVTNYYNGGVALSGTRTHSFPPIDAVVQEAQVKAWLASQDIVHDPVHNAYFEDEGYNQVYQEQCPIYSSQSVAVIGGWHFPWPEGDWQKLQESTLLVWTFRDAEPWVEAWLMPDGSFQVFQHIT